MQNSKQSSIFTTCQNSQPFTIPTGNNTVVYFETEDCITEEKTIEKLGGKIIRPKASIGEFGFVSIFIDSEGNTIGLHSLK
jgi:predicted enzyme related to lactoylglutathione lyase